MFRNCHPVLFVVAALLGSGSLRAADDFSPLGSQPPWSNLEAYQNTITREAFLEEMINVYSIGEAYKLTFDVLEDHVRVKTAKGAWMTLRFRNADDPRPKIKRYWRPRSEIVAAQKSDLPLAGLRIALDPGHLGGRWAKMGT